MGVLTLWSVHHIRHPVAVYSYDNAQHH
jgi:hypothetical protein